MSEPLAETYKGRSVFVTGHTGFKGSWLSLWLHELGAKVTGYSDKIPTTPSAFSEMRLDEIISDIRGDIADQDLVLKAMATANPSVVFHLAAQPIVKTGFADPFGTFQANVLGTVAVLEAARKLPSVKAVVVITSDKVYDNDGSPWAFREDDQLGGHEPYGISKAAAELVAMTYHSKSFHIAAGSKNVPALATVRAGNVIGGGDWADHRLIPDFVRAVSQKTDQEIRQPRATRPWQHVLEPLGGYLCVGARLLNDPEGVPKALNFGPVEANMPDVETVARAFIKEMDSADTSVVVNEDPNSGEAPTLRVDSSLAQVKLGWTPCWSVDDAIRHTATWYKESLGGTNDMRDVSLRQLADYRKHSSVLEISG